MAAPYSLPPAGSLQPLANSIDARFKPAPPKPACGLPVVFFRGRGRHRTVTRQNLVAIIQYCAGDVKPDQQPEHAAQELSTAAKAANQSSNHSPTAHSKSTREMQRPTGPSGIYAEWDPAVWDFGTVSQYPVLKRTPGGVAAQRP